MAGTVTEVILGELRELCPNAGTKAIGRANELTAALTDVVDATHRQFVFVIDEWDAPLRERRTKASQEDWVYFLRLLFKNATFTSKAVAACYMTGILPIIRYGTQSALSDFREYTFLRPHAYAPYVGFTQSDVEQLAARNSMDMDELERWYDGYELHFLDRTAKEHRTLRCYAPFSVMSACENGEVGPYWTSTEAFSSLLLYIDMDFKGLQRSIVQAVAAAVARAHEKGCANAFYNNEQALRAVVKAAYISAADHYAKVEELPSGRGIADVVYLPKRGDAAPALVVELKWDRKPDAAIAQIRNKDYSAVLRDWGGPTLLVGISYNSKSRTHTCTIEEI